MKRTCTPVAPLESGLSVSKIVPPIANGALLAGPPAE
jgi:hypothetical protein